MLNYNFYIFGKDQKISIYIGHHEKKNWKKLSKCYKKSIKKYNKCINNNKCSKKTCEKRCWNKVKTFIKCNKKRNKSIVSMDTLDMNK